MAAKPRGLGKGIGSLIPDVTPVTQTSAKTNSPAPVQQVDATAVYAEIPLSRIIPNPKQPRVAFDEDAMAELVHSLKEIGLLQPIVVRSIAPTNEGADFEIVAGERRWRAAHQAGFSQIPVIIRQTNDDALLRDSLLENLHRAQLNALEEASAYQQLLNDFGCTQEELSKRIGRSRPTITNTIRLLNLPLNVQRRVAAGVISAGHARSLLALATEEEMENLAKRIVAEGLSVRAVEEIVAVGAGSKTTKTKTSKGKKIVSPGLEDIADRLSNKLETRVKIDMARNKGTVSIEFATFEDLQRIINIIDGD
ncbi:MAG: ParB/RepB/Spo0J family partition protein [Actinobacteria bacterium]|nr:ParB/RepB/Spo0J family partition protein [Actinomycetota bacterium]